jgi:hypothetical protein
MRFGEVKLLRVHLTRSRLDPESARLSGQRKDWMSNIPCRNQGNCRDPACKYLHFSPASGFQPPAVKEECKFGLKCTNSACKRWHPSPAAKPAGSTATVKSAASSGGEIYDPCKFQVKCNNPKCMYLHYSPSGKYAKPPASAGPVKREVCKFGGSCTKADCTRWHPSPG